MTESCLTWERVQEIFQECSSGADEDAGDLVEVQVIGSPVWLYKGQLAKHADEIARMLEELPDEFQEKLGGGMSLVEAAADKHGRWWTGSQGLVLQLFLLGLGIGKVELVSPREVWKMLPGGMPYYVVLEHRKAVPTFGEAL